VTLAVGAFLLVAAALGQFWAPARAERTPLDVNTTTRLSGTAQRLDPSTGRVRSVKVRATQVTRSDTSVSDSKVIAFVTSTCLVVDTGHVPDCVDARDPQHRLVSASSDTFATDRHTAMAVNALQYRADRSTPHHGLVNKWPFDTARRTYPFWDDVLDTTTPATYDGTDTIHGLRTDRFSVRVPPTRAEVATGVRGSYSAAETIWVEPRTGSIIKQSRHEVRTLADGRPALDVSLVYTPATVSAAVDHTRARIRVLWLVTTVVPVVGLVVGLPVLLAGLYLLLVRRRVGAHVNRSRTRGRFSLAK
jgi:hypothetical protein